MVKNNLYRKSPIFFQNMLLTGRGFLYNYLRRGRLFRKISRELRKTQYFDAQLMSNWQDKRLRAIVKHAYENVGYYRNLFDKIGLRVSDIKGAEDLRKIPVLDKETVRTKPENFLSVRSRGLLTRKTFTSGTSGKPLELRRDIYSVNFESALQWRQKEWAGVGIGERTVVLREEEILPGTCDKAPFWRHSKSEKKMFLSSYHIAEKNARSYADAIKRFNPAAIEAQPSTLYILAKFMQMNSKIYSFSGLKAVFTSSEVLLERHKKLIAKVFKVPIYDFYGNAERVCAIGTCEDGNYHVLPEAGIVEFIPVDESGSRVEIIGSTLHNYSMPLLRYRTGDVAELMKGKCGCGRHFPLVRNIKGRILDYLITRDGRVAVDVCYLALKGASNIIESQIIQEDLERMKVIVLPAKNFCDRDRNIIVNNIKDYMGPDTEVVLETRKESFKKDFPKYRPFISKLRVEA